LRPNGDIHMNQVENWLSGGDLRSDGVSNEVTRVVIDNPGLLPDLVACLDAPDAVVRGRAADVIEKVGRTLPEALVPYLDRFITALSEDEVPMVRWHLAIASLCILAFQYPSRLPGIASAIAPLEKSRSVALRSRARKAMAALTEPGASLPPGWVKSEHLYKDRKG
jgi:hypothetical protein